MAKRRGRELPKRFDPFRPAGWRCHKVAKMTHNKVAEEAEKVECRKRWTLPRNLEIRKIGLIFGYRVYFIIHLMNSCFA